MGQILSDEGNQEEAINYLIDALRWDSKNGWALVMMGNIFAKFKNDLQTAMKYYDQALVVNPNDYITINNIGGNLLQQNKLPEAKKYFWEAVKINDTYPNSHYALGIIAEIENDYPSAFFSIIKSIKLNNKKDVLYQSSVKMAFDIANKIITGNDGKKIFREYRHKLEFDCGKAIDIVKDDEINTAAKFEFAENYNRTKHIVKFNPKYLAYEHLIMHELVHLDFALAARKVNANQLFISSNKNKADFIKSINHTVKKLNKMGVTDAGIVNYCSGLFEGINRQIYNTPIDLFIENNLYNEFAELRPYQFLSLYTLITEGLNAVTDKKIVEITPKDILSKSKIYNLLNALQFKDLYGIDLIKDFQATPTELKHANDFYEEYLQYKENKEPGEEYELILHWAEDLKLDTNFELVNENDFRKRNNIDELLASIENDPYDSVSKDLTKKREMENFQKGQSELGLNMAVVMFMVDALQYFEKLPKDTVKQIALEIAMQGTQGYRPDNDNYRINSIPGKLFSGYHILAYYYVSWMLAIPEMVSQLQLPYDEEYNMALTIYKPK